MPRRFAIFLFLLATIPVARGQTGTDEHLPTPKGLAADVRFWEKVFGEYNNPDHCIFHDKDDLSMIYVVKRLPGVTRKDNPRHAPVSGCFARGD